MTKRGRGGRPNKGSIASVEGAEFFKVYFPSLSSRQLRIPPDFTKHFTKTLNEKVILKNKDGKTWYVEVKETPNGIFLKDGWQSFVDYHGLKVGEFLVFRYRGSYSFLVQIFGTNGCKKETFDPKNIATHVKSEDETDEEMKLNQISRKRAYPQGKDHLSSFDRRSRVLRRSCRHTDVSEVEEEVGASEQPNNSKESEHTEQVVPKCPFFVSPPCHFKVLRIPEEVVNNENVHLEAKMNLRNAKGKEWPVKIFITANDQVFLGKGLYAFQIDNDVGPEDCCKFTFGTQTTIDVKIIRNSKK